MFPILWHWNLKNSIAHYWRKSKRQRRQAISMIRRMKRRAFLSVCTQRSPLIVFTLMYVKEELEKLGFVQSMSRKGEPHDNAVAENFFSCLKCELVYLTSYATRRQAQNSIFRYIEGFYNPVRPHSSIGWLSPMEYARQLNRQNVAWAYRSNPAIHSTFVCFFVSILPVRGQLLHSKTQEDSHAFVHKPKVHIFSLCTSNIRPDSRRSNALHHRKEA